MPNLENLPEDIQDMLPGGWDLTVGVNATIGVPGSSAAVSYTPITPLLWAISKKNLPLVESLLANGADPNISYDGRFGPNNNSFDEEEFDNAALDMQGNDIPTIGPSPLSYAVAIPDNAAIIKILLAHRAHINFVNKLPQKYATFYQPYTGRRSTAIIPIQILDAVIPALKDPSKISNPEFRGNSIFESFQNFSMQDTMEMMQELGNSNYIPLLIAVAQTESLIPNAPTIKNLTERLDYFFPAQGLKDEVGIINEYMKPGPALLQDYYSNASEMLTEADWKNLLRLGHALYRKEQKQVETQRSAEIQKQAKAAMPEDIAALKKEIAHLKQEVAILNMHLKPQANLLAADSNANATISSESSELSPATSSNTDVKRDTTSMLTGYQQALQAQQINSVSASAITAEENERHKKQNKSN